MAALKIADMKYLGSLFGTRVFYDRMERTLYGHDTAEIPSLVKPLRAATAGRAA